jgi:glycerol-3-phosphate dehydrogenase (NAD(P)+)
MKAAGLPMRAAVIGGGSWGTALALVLGDNGHDVTIWSFEEDVARAITERHENTKYMPGQLLPDRVKATHDFATALAGAELVVAVNPSHVTRAVMRDALPYLPKATPIVSATKGIENDTLFTMHEVLEDVLPSEMHPYLVCLSGPSFAKETMQRMPTLVVAASPWEKIAKKVQKIFSNDHFRVYTSPDVVGAELGGSLKNVCAIAAGISDGMGFGSNTRAAIMTRGLAELVRLAVRKGANPITLSGLAGMGDLVLTCTGELSRNRTVGLALGRGEKLKDVLGGMTQVAEGVRTAKSVHDMAAKLGVEMPLHEAVYRILYEDLPAKAAVHSLATRELKSEFQLH